MIGSTVTILGISRELVQSLRLLFLAKVAQVRHVSVIRSASLGKPAFRPYLFTDGLYYSMTTLM
jgi:hypothetical protein